MKIFPLSTYGTPYDYMSIMHYDRYAFSNNTKETIVTKNEKYRDLIGNRGTMTPGDINYINILYNYSADDISLSRCTCEELDISGLHTQIGRAHV